MAPAVVCLWDCCADVVHTGASRVPTRRRPSSPLTCCCASNGAVDTAHSVCRLTERAIWTCWQVVSTADVLLCGGVQCQARSAAGARRSCGITTLGLQLTSALLVTCSNSAGQSETGAGCHCACAQSIPASGRPSAPLGRGVSRAIRTAHTVCSRRFSITERSGWAC